MPSIAELRRLLKSLAVLDSILEPEWGYRYYSYDASWSKDEEMGSMRNGQGDEFYVLFLDGNCFIKGFDLECNMSPWNLRNNSIWPGVLDNVPSEFSAAAKEPAFSMDNTTFCIWRREVDGTWMTGDIKFPNTKDTDGLEHLLELLDCEPISYQRFARDYFEMNIPLNAILGAPSRRDSPIANPRKSRLKPLPQINNHLS